MPMTHINSIVIPAQAGIHIRQKAPYSLDTGLRRYDGLKGIILKPAAARYPLICH